MGVGLPDRIGRYQVEAVIGTGGFATVYRAVDERLDATVAVKVLAENHSHDPDLRERFLREGQVLRRIDGSHVVTVHDLGETDRGQPYLVLEHADRGDLADRVAARRAAGWQAEPSDLLYVAEVVVDALTAVHASRLVHRDVAPRNLLIRSARVAGTHAGCGLVAADERLLLADLGLSKDLATASGLTAGAGTAGHTPPEQRTGLAEVSSVADIWAASALLVWLLLDEPPDDAGRWVARLPADGWSGALRGPLARGLAWDPADRYGSAPEWFAAVREALLPAPPVAVTGPRGAEVAGTGPGGDVGEVGERPADQAAPGAPAPGAAVRRRRPGSGVSRTGAAVLGAVLGGMLVAGASLLVRDDDPEAAPADQTEEALADGRVRVAADRGGISVAIVGPEEMDVGAEVVLASESEGVDSLVWFGPDGRVHVDEARLAVEASSTGRATVTLVGVTGGGRTVTVTHDLDVVG